MTVNSRVSVVVPCWNEASRIGATLDAMLEVLETMPFPWEVVIVDDGSTDDTARIVAGWVTDPRVRLRRHDRNHGKGFAVRDGIGAATGDLALFTDADLATPIEHLPEFVAEAHRGADLVVASRVLPGSRILTPQPLPRRLAGATFRAVVRALALTRVRDTQCGFKLVRRATVGPLFESLETDGFAFDVELLARAERKRLRISELPVEWRDVRGSKVRLHPDATRMFVELFRLRRRHGPLPRS